MAPLYGTLAGVTERLAALEQREKLAPREVMALYFYAAQFDPAALRSLA